MRLSFKCILLTGGLYNKLVIRNIMVTSIRLSFKI
jgi:hypothetical protein